MEVAGRGCRLAPWSLQIAGLRLVVGDRQMWLVVGGKCACRLEGRRQEAGELVVVVWRVGVVGWL